MAQMRPYPGLDFQVHALNTFSENGSGEQEAFLKMEDAYNELQEVKQHSEVCPANIAEQTRHIPLPSELGTCKTVEAKFWPWLSGEVKQHSEVCPANIYVPHNIRIDCLIRQIQDSGHV